MSCMYAVARPSSVVFYVCMCYFMAVAELKVKIGKVEHVLFNIESR